MDRFSDALQARRARLQATREIHDCVLLDGSVPLPVLEQNVDAWIAQQPSR